MAPLHISQSRDRPRRVPLLDAGTRTGHTIFFLMIGVRCRQVRTMCAVVTVTGAETSGGRGRWGRCWGREVRGEFGV